MTTIEPGNYNDRIRFPTPVEVQLPSRALKRFSKEFPRLFEAFDEARNYARSGKRTPWPSYCYGPSSISQDILYDHFQAGTQPRSGDGNDGSRGVACHGVERVAPHKGCLLF